MRIYRGWSLCRGFLVQYNQMRVDSVESLKRALDANWTMFVGSSDRAFVGFVVALQHAPDSKALIVIDTGSEPIWAKFGDANIGSIIARKIEILEMPESTHKSIALTRRS